MSTYERERNHNNTDADDSKANGNVDSSAPRRSIQKLESLLLDLRRCDVFISGQRFGRVLFDVRRRSRK